MIKNYFLHKQRINALSKYRNENFKSVKSLIEAHNVIVTYPNNVRVSIMNEAKEKVEEAITFYQDEKLHIQKSVYEYNCVNLNRRGAHYRDCLLILLEDMDDIIAVLNEVCKGIIEELDKKQQMKEKLKSDMSKII